MWRTCTILEEHWAQWEAKDSILYWCIFMMFAVLGEKQQDKASLWYVKSYLLNTLQFSQQVQLNYQNVSFWTFSALFKVEKTGRKCYNFPFPWYLSQTTTWTPTSPHFTLLHLCPNKPFILQKATAGEVYLHSPLTAVSSYLTACAPKCP